MTRSLRHISEKPWSEYTKADYTPEQWHKACLIHLHDGTPTSKGQCKLPVRTPGGALSRPGVHAAAAALAGARGGVDAPDAVKNKAATSLIRLYGELGEDPPPSLKHSERGGLTQMTQSTRLDDFLEHYGVPGMKWGVRKRIGDAKGRVRSELKERTSTETTVRAKPGQIVRVVGGNKRLPHEDAVKARTSEQIAKRSTLDALSNKDLQHLVQRMNLEQQYRQMAVKETRKSAALKWTENILSEKGDLLFNRLGPHASVGKKVVNMAFTTVTQNKALLGGSAEKKKDK